MDISDVKSLFEYDKWANARMFDAIEELTEEQFTRDLGNSFPSIRDTLAHIVMAEWVWLRRWNGESPSSQPTWAKGADRSTLRQHLTDIEMERAGFLALLQDADLQRVIAYTNLQGIHAEFPLGDQLLHVVNHSTYHRGQLTTMLRQVGATPPSTDLILYKKEMQTAV